MAALNLAEVAQALSPDEPCGPDLEYDPDFMNVMARLEVALPSAYFRRDDEGRQLPFDRTTIDFAAAFADLGKLLARTRDLRVFVLAGKLALLNRDLAGFSGCLGSVASILSEHWDEVHPRLEDGDPIMRAVALQSLDDMPTVVLPLQHVPLFTSRRTGPLAMRSQLVANGDVRQVEGEEHPDAGAIQAALTDADLDALIAVLGQAGTIKQALAQIQTLWIEKAGYDQAVSFPRLSVLVDQVIAFLDAAVSRRAPGQGAGLASSATSEPGSVPAPTVASDTGSDCSSILQVKDALASCLEYFRRIEPSSPAVLLIGQAQQLIGKSLLEVIQIMFPDHVDKAVIELGGNVKFHLPLERLAQGNGAYEEPVEDYGSAAEEADDGEIPAGDESAPAPAAAMTPVATRAEAISRMKAVAAFYRKVEPSHPTPLLMEKACALAQQDFQSLLGDILPEVGFRPDSES
ncbi:type VI secretion system ImpA family N-terminal domain-containing protein [Bosea sp. BK604]|uniref:type VI secretion system protein TssA n=1 Tax=Bosea sp. BK604 TaxID=2512180 RepID=UPI00104D9A0D|nr:type VI secretion system ImpA family N-terminal domain-containing protein [Bosea sp. BK604]TCR64326.1 type VI secretion system protein ImpA [Bosea sp. BK604]